MVSTPDALSSLFVARDDKYSRCVANMPSFLSFVFC